MIKLAFLYYKDVSFQVSWRPEEKYRTACLHYIFIFYNRYICSKLNMLFRSMDGNHDDSKTNKCKFSITVESVT